MERRIKVGIADDHPLVISGLQHMLNNCLDMSFMGSYANGEELLAGLALRQPDVLLLDIHMPGLTGDELAQFISGRYPRVKMIALTNLDNIFYVKTMLRCGVNGYLLKTSRAEIMIDAIRTVHKGGQFLEPVLKEKILHETLQAGLQDGTVPPLSRREKDVLQYIASDFTSQQIADKLFLSKRTVDNHRLSLFMKLGVKNAAALVKKAILLGLI